MAQRKGGLELSRLVEFIDIREWAREELSHAPPMLHSSGRVDLQRQLRLEEASFSSAVHPYDAATSILKLRFTLAPIRLLPSDLFSYICDLLPQYVVPTQWKSLANVMNVCYSWRTAIVGNPRIWSSVQLGLERPAVRPASVEYWLKRSKSHPLNLVLIGNSRLCRPPAFEQALPHFSRLETLTLSPDGESCSAVRLKGILLALSTATGLTSLTLSWSQLEVSLDEACIKCLKSHPINLPNLMELQLVWWPIRNMPLITAPNLKCLKLGDIVGLLDGVRAELWHDAVDNLASMYPTTAKVAMAYISPEHLQLGDAYEEMNHERKITFPNLRALTVVNEEVANEEFEETRYSSIHGCIVRGSPTIFHLDITVANILPLPPSSSITSIVIRIQDTEDFDATYFEAFLDGFFLTGGS